jgi:hypothetical protein
MACHYAMNPIRAAFSADEHNFGKRANDQLAIPVALKTVSLKITCEY